MTTETQKSPTRAELARELLLYKMEEYSEDGFCASWLVDLEYELWNAADQPEDPAPLGCWTKSTSKECRILAEIAGGWWVFEDDSRPGEEGPVFLPMARWLERLAEEKI